MRRSAIVLSDVHLAPTFESDRLPFRSPAFSPAVYLSQTIDRAVEEARAERAGLEIVLAGDVFDFDVPQSAEEAAAGLRLCDTTDPRIAAQVLQRTMDDHLPFGLALQRATRAGARVVVLPGNHDAQLCFDVVRAVLGRAFGPGITFAPWYYGAAGGVVHVEHGHLYDPLCAVTRLCPDATSNSERTIGTVSSFYAPLLMPGVDPFVTDPFADRRTLRSMLAATKRLDTRSLLACMKELWTAGARDGRAADDTNALAAMLGLDPSSVDYLRGFFAPKATPHEVVDICSGGIDYARAVEDRTCRAMVAATMVHGAQIAVVGHTHRPSATLLSSGTTLLNSGAWTPRRSANEPVGSYAWVSTDNGSVRDATVKHVFRS